jgi:hypothetical protein
MFRDASGLVLFFFAEGEGASVAKHLEPGKKNTRNEALSFCFEND